MSIILKYVGDGRFIPGIPDRDLTSQDIENIGMTEKELIQTGLYTKAVTAPPSNKADLKGYSNKQKESE